MYTYAVVLCMKFGFVPKEGGDDFDGVLEEARIAEELGFDSCMLTEHHGTSHHYWGAPLVRFGAIAAETANLELVTGIIILPLRKPVELAEKIAVLDRMSEGRVTLGVGLGYVEEEFDAFNVPIEERTGRLIEGLKFLDKVLASEGPVSFDSEFFTLNDWELIPSPVQDPRPPLWLGGWGDKALNRSMKFADTWLPGLTADIEEMSIREEKLQTFAADASRNWDNISHPIQRELVVAETTEEAMKLGEEHLYTSHVGEYGSDDWQHPVISQEAVTDFESLAEDRFLVGTPAEIVEQIEAFQEALTIDQFFFRIQHPGMDHEDTVKQLELLGDEVLPQIN